MANTKDFNPKAVFVCGKEQGVRLGGRKYQLGEAVKDDCISTAKKLQLFKQGVLKYPYMIEKHLVSSETTPPAVKEEAPTEDPVKTEIKRKGRPPKSAAK